MSATPTQAFFVSGPLPGLNELLDWAKRQGKGTGKKQWNLYAVQKKSWEEVIWAAIHNANLQPYACPVTIDYLWQEPNRRRDPSNISAGKKFIEDTLVKAGILRGDGWRDIWGFSDRFSIDKKRPGVHVTINDV